MADETSTPVSDPNEDALRENFELGEGVRRLGRLLGVHTLHRNLKAEDHAVARNIHALEEMAISGYPEDKGAEIFKAADEATKPSQSEDSEMGDILAGKDVVINNFYGQTPPSEPSTPENTVAAKTPDPVASPMQSVPTEQPPLEGLQDAVASLAKGVASQQACLDKLTSTVASLAQKPSPSVTAQIPNWLKIAIASGLVGSPLLAALSSYMLRPDTPAWGFEVLPGVTQPEESPGSASTDRET